MQRRTMRARSNMHSRSMGSTRRSCRSLTSEACRRSIARTTRPPRGESAIDALVICLQTWSRDDRVPVSKLVIGDHEVPDPPASVVVHEQRPDPTAPKWGPEHVKELVEKRERSE